MMLSKILQHLDALVGFDTRNPPRAIGTDGIIDYLRAQLPDFRIEVIDHGAGAVSMLAQRGIDSKGKISLNKQTGANSYLRLELPNERAWASLEAAVQRAGFTVEDRNRTAQELVVRFTPPVDPEDKKGWWGRFWAWAFNDDKDALTEKDLLLVKMQPLVGSDNSVRIDLQRVDNKPLKTSITEDLLNRIKNKLS